MLHAILNSLKKKKKKNFFNDFNVHDNIKIPLQKYNSVLQFISYLVDANKNG